MTSPLRLLIVADFIHEPVISRLLDYLPVDTCWLGSADPVELSKLEQSLGLTAMHDLREASTRDDLDATLLLTSQALLDDEWRALLSTNRPVLLSESVNHAFAGNPQISFIPRYSNSPALRQIEQTIGEFGTLESITITTLAQMHAGSAGARLYDAIDAVTRLCGPIESVHGRFHGNHRGSLPDSPTGLSGRIAATFQLDSGQIGCILAGHARTPWMRSCLITCDTGIIMADDLTCQWHSSEQDTCEINIASTLSTYEQLLADRICALVDEMPSEPPPRRHDVIAAWTATWLSCRTGQVEYPGHMPIG